MVIFKAVSKLYLFTNSPIAIVSVINDLATDHRVHKTCAVLEESGYQVVLHGRLLADSLELPHWTYKSKRIRMLFKKGPLFYFFYNIRLFFYLLFHKTDLLFANDLDTLGANYLASRIKRIPLIYDSHELFCDVPELLHSPLKRKVWQKLESFIVPKLNYCITVNESIAQILSNKFQVSFLSIRNIPQAPVSFQAKSRLELGLPMNKKILLMQGAGLNMDRGVEELIEAMKFVDNAYLLIIGSGDNWSHFQDLSTRLNLNSKVQFIPKLKKSELLHFTYNADLGFSLDKNTSANYRYSLPNKIFDYIHCGVPILASRLPEVEKIIDKYQVGEFIDSHDPKHIADRILSVLSDDKMSIYKFNTKAAANELSWVIEKKPLLDLFLRVNTKRP